MSKLNKNQINQKDNLRDSSFIDGGKIVLNLELEKTKENLDHLFDTFSVALALSRDDDTDHHDHCFSAILAAIYKARIEVSDSK